MISQPPSKPRKLSARYLTDLAIERVSSSSSSSKSGGGGAYLRLTIEKTSEYWAGLRFTSIESLVLFHSMLLALRSHDSWQPIQRIRDHRLRGEEEVFEAVIHDDRYAHFLKLLHDTATHTLRLQASVLDGEGGMKRAPVWTGWVTHLVHSPRWCSWEGGKVVVLGELTRWVFADRENYDEAAIVGDGGVALAFEGKGTAEAFVVAIEGVRKEAEKRAGKGKEKDGKDGKGKDGKGGKGKDKDKDKGGKDKGGKDKGGKAGKAKDMGGHYHDGGQGQGHGHGHGHDTPPPPPPAPNAPRPQHGGGWDQGGWA